ncbi:MAG: PEPxxWA-CTERM sorting domain-containing protein [Proteobacteria bacterium]|nr:PEPxxWA-CTERM sorting domain-containing protein [Pseudomonadota bacterium]
MSSKSAFRASRLFSGAACAAALAIGLGVAAPASADIYWLVSGLFDDGGTLSGFFDINVYGYLQNYDLVTTAGSTVTPGYEYTPSDSYFSNGTFYVDAQPGYRQDLHLDFLLPINVKVAVNPIVGGSPGPSYECVGSYSCYDLGGGTTRFLASGFAAAPEPAAWALMIGGFGLAGAMLRRRRALATA